MASPQTQVNRSLNMAVPGFNNSISSRAPFGMAYALLQHDMTQRFLLHFFTLSAHSYTRGHWTILTGVYHL